MGRDGNVSDDSYLYQCPICHVVRDCRDDAEDHVERHPGVKPSAVVVI